MNASDTSCSQTVSAIPEDTTAQRLGVFIFAFGMFILTVSFLSSCNTTRGLGRDVQHVGNHIEHHAAKVQAGM